MSSPLVVDMFVEDRAHEAFLVPMLGRIAREEEVNVSHRIRSARGGHGRAIAEMRLYQNRPGRGDAGLVIVGIDGNCTTSTKARQAIQAASEVAFRERLVVACPDPHIERWYLADPDSFKSVVGHRPTAGKRNCKRDHYKSMLAQAIWQAGHPTTLGGIEFARELVEAMDLYRAGKTDRSLKVFADDLRAGLRKIRAGKGGAAE